MQSRPLIRPMTPSDVEPASASVLRGGWGDRRAFFEFIVGRPAFLPLVAEADGAVVGTGLGTVNGPVGRVGVIFVSPDIRGRGLGTALTEAVVERLEDAGCRSLVLVASEHGLRMYERLGFTIQTRYHTYVAPGVAPDRPDAAVRPLAVGDTDALIGLDRAATGEDRSHLLAALVGRETGWALDGPDGSPSGFVLRAPWGGGATIVPDPLHALRLLEHRRRVAGPGREVKCGVLAENVQGRALLEANGWREAWNAPHLSRGEPLAWRPESIWGQFNHAIG